MKTHVRSIDPSLAKPRRFWRGCSYNNLVSRICLLTLLCCKPQKRPSPVQTWIFQEQTNVYVYIYTHVHICVCVSMPDALPLRVTSNTGWRRPIGGLKLQVIFHKRATNCRALLLKMTCKDTASYRSSPPCSMPMHYVFKHIYICVYMCIHVSSDLK